MDERARAEPVRPQAGICPGPPECKVAPSRQRWRAACTVCSNVRCVDRRPVDGREITAATMLREHFVEGMDVYSEMLANDCREASAGS